MSKRRPNEVFSDLIAAAYGSDGQNGRTACAIALNVRHDTVRQWCNGRRDIRPEKWFELLQLASERMFKIADLTHEMFDASAEMRSIWDARVDRSKVENKNDAIEARHTINSR